MLEDTPCCWNVRHKDDLKGPGTFWDFPFDGPDWINTPCYYKKEPVTTTEEYIHALNYDTR
jgi:hypothetical protein